MRTEDVTENVRLKTQLVEALAALDASNEELEAFCYSVAHDLRAPLRGIQGFSQALLEDYSASVDAKGQDYLKRVSTAALRMSDLIDDLLALSRISRGPLVRGPVDLTAVATQIAERSRTDRGRQVKTTIADGLQANADPRLLQIVFENLLGNAWKFTSKIDDPAVEVGSQSVDGTVQFFVRDNGAGFDRATRRSSSPRFSGCTPTRNFRERASGWPPCSASCAAMAAGCGRTPP